MRFPEQFTQQVAQATDIVDLVSRYVSLTRRGKEFVCLCPFHDDHKPSMCVVPAKQIFYCFVCNAGGNVFQWMILYEKLTFPEAVKALAERANIPLPRQDSPPPVDDGCGKSDLQRVCAFAARHFQAQLRAPVGENALKYAHSRGLTDESIQRFGLGFSVGAWDALIREAVREGFTSTQLVAAGLAIRREGSSGIYDRFRNRLMFPIIDPSDNIIAFGGRALDPAEQAKYINSPETPLFDKSNNLYALNWARQAISTSGRAVVVEGYMDALIPLQAGVGNVVATLGTALGDRHVRLLNRFSREVVLIYDSDAAGQKAADRALEIFLAQQLHVRVASVPSGKDPCDYVLAEGGEALQRLIEAAPDAMEYAWSRRQKEYQAAGGNLADQRRVLEDFLSLVVSSSAYGAIDEIRRGQLAQHIGHVLHLPAADLQAGMRRLERQVRRATPPTSASSAPAAPVRSSAPRQASYAAERHVLEVLLNRPDLFDSIVERIVPRDFADEELGLIASHAWEAGLAQRLNLDELMAVEALAPHSSLLAELALTGQRRGNYEETLSGAVEDILYRRQRQEMQDLKSGGLSDETLRQLDRQLRRPDLRRRPRIT